MADEPIDVYDITAGGHLQRAQALRNAWGKQKAPQFCIYAALELRNCIERVLFEYLVIIHGADVSKKIEKKYTANKLKETIISIEPEFLQKIKYVNLILKAVGKQLAPVPDLDKLCRIYGELNDFLHAWKRPKKTVQDRKWWERLLHALAEAETVLLSICSRPIAHPKFNQAGMEQYEEWKRGELTDAEVVERLRQELELS